MPARDTAATMYPPRYFVGWIVFESAAGRLTRLTFTSAILIPLTTHRAVIYAGNRRSPFYSETVQDADVSGRVREIQYAISALNARTLKPEIEKFNHKFAKGPWLQRDNDHFLLKQASQQPKLFMTMPLSDVLDHAQDSKQPVIQFSS